MISILNEKKLSLPGYYSDFLNKKPKPNLPKNFFSKAQKKVNCPNNQPTMGSVN
jgi:hypothetical protein